MSANWPKRRRGFSMQDQADKGPQTSGTRESARITSPSQANAERHPGLAESSMIGQQNSEGKMLLLPLPRRMANMSRNSEKNRTTHACDLCRKAKAKCTGGQPCQKCQNECKECFYGDGKRDKERKILQRTSNKFEALRAHAESLRSSIRKVVHHSNLSELEQETIKELLDQSPPSLSDYDDDSVGSQHHSPYSLKHSGEFDADGEGSTASLDNIAVDTNRDEESRTTGFLGKSSSVRWIQRAEREVHGESPIDQIRSEPALYHTGDPDLCEPIAHENKLWKYELPEPEVAAQLVDSYFVHVHQDFPILSKEKFLERFHYYTKNRGRIYSEKDHIALCQINCVFAIGSTFAHLVAKDVQPNPQDHLIYYARTRALGLEEQPVNALASLEYICSLGLLGLYLVSNYFINRAWITIGLAVRNAQTFGLHVRSKAIGLSEFDKEHRNQIWWSLFSLEHLMNEITGRPSCISQGDISAPHPVNRDQKGTPAERQAGSSSSRAYSKRLRNSETRGKERAVEAQGLKESHAISSLYASPSLAITSDSYFSHRMAVIVLTHEMLQRLYCASTVNIKWNEVQDIIRDLDAKLQEWKRCLPDELKFPARRNMKDEHENKRKGLEVIYHTSRMILHRPALCRMEERIKNESATSQKFNHGAVTSCVESARSLLATLGKPADPIKLYLIRPWWEILHHLCQAAGILMLEIAFSACHIEGETAEILQDAKDAVHWLRAMSRQSIPARKAWQIHDRTLRLVGTKINADISDMLTEADVPPGWDPLPAVYQSAPLNEETISGLDFSSLPGMEGSQTQRSAATNAWAHGFSPTAAAPIPGFHHPNYPNEPSFRPEFFQTAFSQGVGLSFSTFGEDGFPLYDEALFPDPVQEMQGFENPGLGSYHSYNNSLEPPGVGLGNSNQIEQSRNDDIQSYRDFENSFRADSTYGQQQPPPRDGVL